MRHQLTVRAERRYAFVLFLMFMSVYVLYVCVCLGHVAFWHLVMDCWLLAKLLLLCIHSPVTRPFITMTLKISSGAPTPSGGSSQHSVWRHVDFLCCLNLIFVFILCNFRFPSFLVFMLTPSKCQRQVLPIWERKATKRRRLPIVVRTLALFVVSLLLLLLFLRFLFCIAFPHPHIAFMPFNIFGQQKPNKKYNNNDFVVCCCCYVFLTFISASFAVCQPRRIYNSSTILYKFCAVNYHQHLPLPAFPLSFILFFLQTYYSIHNTFSTRHSHQKSLDLHLYIKVDYLELFVRLLTLPASTKQGCTAFKLILLCNDIQVQVFGFPFCSF